MPAAYERGMVGPVFEPFAEHLSAAVAARRPGRVLELAAGTGVLTRRLVRLLPEAAIVATDLNEAMVSLGQELVPEAEWQPVDAMSLPYDDASFDVVVCQFGVMFLPDRVAAYRGMRRVLRSGGALLFNAWGDVEEHTYEKALVQVLHALFPDDPPTFMESTPHGYSDPMRIESDVRAAGFNDVTVETLHLTSEVDSVAALATGYCEGSPVRAELARRGDVAELTGPVVAEMQKLLGPGPITGTMAAHEVVARRDD
jgi:ubiquinone/menaquinone biosynthesis C-methylase UbiE